MSIVGCAASIQVRDNGAIVLRSYRDLRVWTAAIELTVDVYELTGKLPAHELFGVTAQTRRAAVSLASNIAEGHARAGAREFLRFLSIARGSLAEVDTQFTVIVRLGYVSVEDVEPILRNIEIISKMIRRLQQALARRVR